MHGQKEQGSSDRFKAKNGMKSSWFNKKKKDIDLITTIQGQQTTS
jgi:hypothetical protein